MVTTESRDNRKTSLSPSSTSPTVFVVDDDSAAREWVRGIAESVGFQVKTFGTAMEFFEQYEADQRGCLLLDVRMPRVTGLDLQELLRAKHIEIPIVMMSAFAEIGVAVRALKGGAVDFIEKPCGAQVLIDAINQAIDRDERMATRRGEKHHAQERLAELTERECEVLDAILAGHSNKVIAADLGISERTVEARRAHLMKKMGVDSIAELVQLALLGRSE